MYKHFQTQIKIKLKSLSIKTKYPVIMFTVWTAITAFEISVNIRFSIHIGTIVFSLPLTKLSPSGLVHNLYHGYYLRFEIPIPCRFNSSVNYFFVYQKKKNRFPNIFKAEKFYTNI